MIRFLACSSRPVQIKPKTDARAIKHLEYLAGHYGCLFIVIGQSNKEAEGIKESKKNEYGVLRGSREIQDVAYCLYLLHRKKQTGQLELHENKTELLLQKPRTCGPGAPKVELTYYRRASIFELAITPADRADIIVFPNDEYLLS